MPATINITGVRFGRLKECADDLEYELNEKYTAELRLYSSQQAKYRRDMRPVIAARAALAKAGVK